ncbi:MAG: prephenate dehydratase [Myxococcota bacterium]
MGKPGQSSRADVKSDPESELARLRERIDAIDDEILERLNARARVVQEVGRIKQNAGSAVFSQARESEIVARLAAASAGPFPEDGLAPVFREIISATRSLEKVVRVGYLGPEGTFSHLAAREQFGELADLQPQASIAEVFSGVERGKVELGIVPVENTTDGIVTQSYDRLPEFEGTLCGELLLRISHDLFSQSGRIGEVRRVVSHPQPLAQCREWLERHLPGVDRVEAASTVAACRLASEDPGVAAIGGAAAGQAAGLATIEAAIEDRRDNTTRFLLIGRQAPAPSGNDLTSVVFTLRKDESGALHRLLEPFARTGVNLTSLQLRPIKGKPWEYLFFLDLEGHAGDPRVVEALETASACANSHRILGSFPRAARRRE